MKYKRCVITGGIGSGKTTLLEAIKKESKTWCADEQALSLVTKELKSEGSRLPWTQPEEVSRMVIPRRIALFKEAPISRCHCIFDRGIPDSLGFLRMAGVVPPRELTEACALYRYDLIFWAPPWKEIYRNRAERIQPWSHAEPLGFTLKAIYEELGYAVIEIPRVSVEKRVGFVLQTIGAAPPLP